MQVVGTVVDKSDTETITVEPAVVPWTGQLCVLVRYYSQYRDSHVTLTGYYHVPAGPDDPEDEVHEGCTFLEGLPCVLVWWDSEAEMMRGGA